MTQLSVTKTSMMRIFLFWGSKKNVHHDPKRIKKEEFRNCFTFEKHCIEITFCACSQDVYDIFVFSDVDKQF